MPAPNCLTVLAPITSGETETLREILRANGDDIKGRRPVLADGADSRIEFLNSQQIHFARFAILRDPDRGPSHTRLLFASVHDGDVDSHVQEIVAITSNLDIIWGKCEGYSGAGNFAQFIKTHSVDPAAYYVAFRDETVESIQTAVAFFYGQLNGQRITAGRGILQKVFGKLEGLLRALPILIDVLRAVLMFGLLNVVRATRQIVASLNRIAIIRLFNRLTHNTMPALESHYSSVLPDNCSAPQPLEDADEVPWTSSAGPPSFREDVVAQNQLTLITAVDREHVDHLRAVMSAIDSYARRLSPPGSLIGVSTIHFVRWLVIDDGRRLLMISDYDGSWENYIDEFAEMILSGLDAIWATSYGYPPDGARDLPAFKRFLRNHQVPSELFFSAYPDATVLNVFEAVK